LLYIYIHREYCNSTSFAQFMGRGDEGGGLCRARTAAIVLSRTSWGCSIYSAGKPNLRTADGRDNGRARCRWAWSGCLARAYTVPLACPRRRRRPAWPASWPADRPASRVVPTTTVRCTYRPRRTRFCPSPVCKMQNKRCKGGHDPRQCVVRFDECHVTKI